jgi:ubiquinone/menaquinone biosynthesis C-methylase UbiE
MNKDFSVQVKKGYYLRKKYNDLERFISYYYQIATVIDLGVDNILEIGVGNKLTADYLKSLEIRVTTCDFDDQVKPDILGDVRDLPVSDNSFDAVLAFQILEHLPFEEFPRALSELKRVSRQYVVISLPFRSTYFELVIKFPFIRTLLKKHWLDLTLRKGVKFPGFEAGGQHYWEIDQHQYKLKNIKKILKEHFDIVREFSPVLDKYHYFFVLKKKT